MISAVIFASACAVAFGAAAATNHEPEQARHKVPDISFLRTCAFVCVDLQPGGTGRMTDVPDGWKKAGITVDDANAAGDYARNVCLPNARKVADACRAAGLPMIFIHWGYALPDGMDLAPPIRKSFIEQFGLDCSKWPHHISRPDSRPALELGVRPGEYVLPKSDQDAFGSSSIGFVLENLGVKNIVFVGGHTGACLGKTAASAKRLGYRILCIEDATNDAAQSRRIPNIVATGYNYVMRTEQFTDLATRYAKSLKLAAPGP